MLVMVLLAKPARRGAAAGSAGDRLTARELYRGPDASGGGMVSGTDNDAVAEDDRQWLADRLHLCVKDA